MEESEKKPNRAIESVMRYTGPVDTFLFQMQRFLAKYGSRLRSFLVGILAGRLTNELSSRDLKELWQRMFSVTGRPLNWFTWGALSVLFLLVLLPRAVDYLRRTRHYEDMLLLLLRRLRGTSLAKYHAIAVDQVLTLQKSPELSQGWTLSQIDVQHSTSRFQLPDDLVLPFKQYAKEKAFKDDNISIMLIENPGAFVDSPTLELKTRETHYNQVQFYRERVVWDPSKRESLTEALIGGRAAFPHNLCMHIVVVTSDDRILITKRSSKVDYYPETWSCSIEEQFSQVDLTGRQDQAIRHWIERALEEELGLTAAKYALENIRILAVFLEASILNIGLAAIVTLSIGRRELSGILEVLPRKDYEFTEFGYLSYQEMSKELVRPRKRYHPTSRYRMLLALIHRYGESDFARRFVSESGLPV
jgi:isopentenyldiphosphate isomerase